MVKGTATGLVAIAVPPVSVISFELQVAPWSAVVKTKTVRESFTGIQTSAVLSATEPTTVNLLPTFNADPGVKVATSVSAPPLTSPIYNLMSVIAAPLV